MLSMAQLQRTFSGTQLEEAELVARCNMMMAAAGLVAKAQTAEDVLAICSSTSVFVAAFEQLTGKRIPGVVRSPKGTADRTENCRRVVQSIARLFQLDLSHLVAQRIVSGDPQQTASLLELIVAIPKHKPDFATTSQELGPPIEVRVLRAPVINQGRRLRDRIVRDTRTKSVSQPETESEPEPEPEWGRGAEAILERSDRNWSRKWNGKQEGEDGSPTGEAIRDSGESETSASQTPGELRKSRGVKAHARHQRQPNSHKKQLALRSNSPPTQRFRETQASEHASESESATREGDISEDGPFPLSACFRIPSAFRLDSEPTQVPSHPTAGTLRKAPQSGRPGDVSRLDCVTSGRRGASVGAPDNDRTTDGRGASDSCRVGDVLGDISAEKVGVSTRKADVSEVLSLVARVGWEEDRDWARKQAAFKGQLARMGRRAYAPRWPFRPLPDLQNVRKMPRQRPGIRDWVRAEEQRLQKRKKRLVPLARPRAGGRGSGALGLARCRKAYRGFLPASEVPPRREPKPTGPTPLTDPDRLFSKETLKQLNDVLHSPVSTLDAPRSDSPNLQTLLRKHPELRQLLVGPRDGMDGRSVRKLFEELPLNPGARKGLAETVAGLEALKRKPGVRSKPEEANQERTWRQVELWAEGIVPRTEPKMRSLAQARLRGRLESHQQKRRQIQAERFKEEVAKDQKAAAVKRAGAEERLVKALLEKAVSLEKEAILTQRKEARERIAAEQRNKQAETEQAEAEIRARCALLKEEIQAKRREREEIERAQQQVMRQLAREERERLESERAMLLERLALKST